MAQLLPLNNYTDCTIFTDGAHELLNGDAVEISSLDNAMAP